MVDFKKLLNIKEKSADDLARERLEKASGNSGWVGGISGCALALIFTFPIFLVVENPFTKTILGLSTLLLTAAIAFFVIMQVKQKNAMKSVLEDFLAGERDIANIATHISANVQYTVKLIQTMMAKKIIIDANIDRTNNVIVDSKKTNCSPDNIGKIIICTGCGAKNTFTGKVGQRCEYCGAVISEEMINDNNRNL